MRYHETLDRFSHGKGPGLLTRLSSIAIAQGKDHVPRLFCAHTEKESSAALKTASFRNRMQPGLAAVESRLAPLARFGMGRFQGTAYIASKIFSVGARTIQFKSPPMKEEIKTSMLLVFLCRLTFQRRLQHSRCILDSREHQQRNSTQLDESMSIQQVGAAFRTCRSEYRALSCDDRRYDTIMDMELQYAR